MSVFYAIQLLSTPQELIITDLSMAVLRVDFGRL
jgi:hypothetical protein